MVDTRGPRKVIIKVYDEVENKLKLNVKVPLNMARIFYNYLHYNKISDYLDLDKNDLNNILERIQNESAGTVIEVNNKEKQEQIILSLE
ncbi:hypothetical protein [Natranaerobius trueperi]|uniref:Uncharacterized protein n=1 Tax=Natranaerobius trueperi TaxID=759412 RepID=A0A226C2X0_9FIRM|nr:hypothetical protein [Natranaerobius trueperi]OWZ84730.1 hypothetical protein CDO51_01525 [Natranaerobius trueperi]